jgi:hypothetical protein
MVSGMVLARKYDALFPWALFLPAAATGAAGLLLWRRRLGGR